MTMDMERDGVHDDEARDHAGEGRRVLIVDDNRDFAEATQILLTALGYHVAVEHHGRSGLETARRFVPEICLVDIGLPGIDGYELARRLRADVPEARLVAVTGYAGDRDLVRSRQAGFDAYVTKPPNLDALLRVFTGGERTGPRRPRPRRH